MTYPRLRARRVDFGVFAGDATAIEPGQSRTYSFLATRTAKADDFWFPSRFPSRECSINADLWITSILVGKHSQLIGALAFPVAILDTTTAILFDTIAPGVEFSFVVENRGKVPQAMAARLTIWEAECTRGALFGGR